MAEKRYGYVDASIHDMEDAELFFEVEEEELKSSSDSIEVRIKGAKGEISGEMIELLKNSPSVIQVKPVFPVSSGKEWYEEVEVSIEIDTYMGAEARLRRAASVIAGAIFSAIDADSLGGTG